MPAPTFEEVGGTFRVSLQNATKIAFPEGNSVDLARFCTIWYQQPTRASPSPLITQGRITNRAYQDLCPDVSHETLRRDLVDMVKERDIDESW